MDSVLEILRLVIVGPVIALWLIAVYFLLFWKNAPVLKAKIASFSAKRNTVFWNTVLDNAPPMVALTIGTTFVMILKLLNII